MNRLTLAFYFIFCHLLLHVLTQFSIEIYSYSVAVVAIALAFSADLFMAYQQKQPSNLVATFAFSMRTTVAPLALVYSFFPFSLFFN